jgi:hypothetical protein
MQACPVTTAENRAGNKIERRDALVELAHELLIAQFMGAAVAAPLVEIPTPDWADDQGGQRAARMVDVLDDGLAGKGSDALWVELITALTKSPEGMAFLQARAKAYATTHELAEAGVL